MGIPRLRSAAVGAWLPICAGLQLTACSADPSGAVAVVASELRPDAPGPSDLPPFYEPGDEVEHFDSDSGFFRVHFTRSGEHAVPATDANRDGVPDYVALVGVEYDAILTFYRDTLGYLPPVGDDAVPDANGGDGRFDVYLLDFATSADGSFRREHCLPDRPASCSGYMVLENDFDGRSYPSRAQAVRIVASHELFHAVQNAYHAGGSVVLGEATAVWASESYDPSLHDFEGFIGGYLARADRSLTQEPSGPVDDFSYGSALFFRYLEERFGRDLIRELWEAVADDPAGEPSWTDLLDQTLSRRHQSSLATAFAEFTRWNLYTGKRADAEHGYREGSAYPALSELAVDLPWQDDLVRVFPLAARFYSARAQAPGEVTIAFSAPNSALLDGLRLIIAREADSRIIDVQSLPSETRSATIRVDAAGEVIHAALLNTRLAGESARPAVCFGFTDTLQPCLRALDAGTAGAAAGNGGASASSMHDGGGCSVSAPANPSGLWPITWLLAAMLMHGHRPSRSKSRRSADFTQSSCPIAPFEYARALYQVGLQTLRNKQSGLTSVRSHRKITAYDATLDTPGLSPLATRGRAKDGVAAPHADRLHGLRRGVVAHPTRHLRRRPGRPR